MCSYDGDKDRQQGVIITIRFLRKPGKSRPWGCPNCQKSFLCRNSKAAPLTHHKSNSNKNLWKYRFLDILRNKSEFARLTRLPYSDLLTTFLPSTMIVILRFENTKIFKSDVGNSIVIVIILAQPPCQHLVRRVHRHGSGGQSYHAPSLGHHVSLTSIKANVFYL